jgi:hypothetical protein
MLSQETLFAIASGGLSGLVRSPFSRSQHVLLLLAGEGPFSSGLRRRFIVALPIDPPDTVAVFNDLHQV